MPEYTFTFDFNIGDKVKDLVTEYEVTVIGVSYCNGQILNEKHKFFHDDIYTIQFLDEIIDVRNSFLLEKLHN